MEYIKQDLKSIINIKQIVTIHYYELTHSASYPIDTHDFWEIHYVDKGSAVCYEDGKQFSLSQGDILFNKPNGEHCLMSKGNNTPNVCVISFVCKSRAMRAFEGKKIHLTADQTAILRKFLTEANATFEITNTSPNLKELCKRNTIPYGALQMLKLHLEELFLLLLRDMETQDVQIFPIIDLEEYPDTLVNDLINYMRVHLADKVTINALCDEFHYSKTYLCKRFYAVTGYTINHYFTKLKIDAAKKIIRSQSSSRIQISQIVNMLNFSTSSYFSYVFKKFTGMSPVEYAVSIRHYESGKKTPTTK